MYIRSIPIQTEFFYNSSTEHPEIWILIIPVIYMCETCWTAEEDDGKCSLNVKSKKDLLLLLKQPIGCFVNELH